MAARVAASAMAERTAVHWGWISGLYTGQAAERVPQLGLVLMNTPLSASLLKRCWRLAETRICADGAAERLRRTCAELVPNLIVGDFDSISPSVLESYRSQGVHLSDLSHDQGSTDLQKALAAAETAGCERVIIAGQSAGIMGRLDHTFGIVNALFLHAKLQPVVVGDDSMMFLLQPGEHRIVVPNAASAPHCGLVPVGAPCGRISTSGLQWDMHEASMQFGGDISICNRVDPAAGGEVSVTTSSHVLWMCTQTPSTDDTSS